MKITLTFPREYSLRLYEIETIAIDTKIKKVT